MNVKNLITIQLQIYYSSNWKIWKNVP